MPYDWEKAATDSKQNAPKIPAGAGVDVKIAKVIFGSKDGKFSSTNGDPQIMLIFADSVDREASLMVTLSDKAAWKLAQILSAAGANVKRMTEAGITPDKFTDEQFANANLVNRRLKIDISYNDKGYAEVVPLRPEPADAAGGAGAKKDDEIPF